MSSTPCYRRFEQTRSPLRKPVTFCLMDVSGSMDEHLKDSWPKRFYSLLDRSELPVIAMWKLLFAIHTRRRSMQDTFFSSRETGKMPRRPRLKKWCALSPIVSAGKTGNIYAAQASDWAISSYRQRKKIALLKSSILPRARLRLHRLGRERSAAAG